MVLQMTSIATAWMVLAEGMAGRGVLPHAYTAMIIVAKAVRLTASRR